MRLADIREILSYRVKKQSNTESFNFYLNKEIDLAVRDHANLAYPWRELQQKATLALLSSNTTGEYILPNDLHEVKYLWHTENQSYNPINLKNPEEFFRSLVSTVNTASYPEVAMLTNSSAVITQPSVASAILVNSTSSADVGIRVTIVGIVGNYPDSEVITTSLSDGTITVSTTKLFTRIDGVVKSGTTIGRICLSIDGTNIAEIPTQTITLESHYKSLNIYPLVSSNMTAYYIYTRKQKAINLDSDMCILSDSHDSAILWLAQYYIYGEEHALKNYLTIKSNLVAREPSSNDRSYLKSKFDPVDRRRILPRFGANYEDPWAY